MRRRSRSRSGDRSSTRKHEKKEKKREKKHHKHSKKTKEADESLEMEALRMLAKQNADDMLLPMDFGSVVSDYRVAVEYRNCVISGLRW